jgi:hypothetical protein
VWYCLFLFSYFIVQGFGVWICEPPSRHKIGSVSLNLLSWIFQKRTQCKFSIFFYLMGTMILKPRLIIWDWVLPSVLCIQNQRLATLSISLPTIIRDLLFQHGEDWNRRAFATTFPRLFLGNISKYFHKEFIPLSGQSFSSIDVVILTDKCNI